MAGSFIQVDHSEPSCNYLHVPSALKISNAVFSIVGFIWFLLVQTATICLNRFVEFILAMETRFDLSDVRTEFLNIILASYYFKEFIKAKK